MTIKDVKGRTPLHNAAWGREGGRGGKKTGSTLLDDSPECVQLLLDYGHFIDECDLDGFTPFFSSVSSNGVKSFLLLLKNGANVNHKTNKGENACLIAAKYGRMETLKPLIEEYKLNFNERDSYQISTLEAAAISDCDEPLKCFDYMMEKVFASENDKLRTFTFENFFFTTEYYKRQDYLVYLIRNKKIEDCLRQIFKSENLVKLFEEGLKLKQENFLEFVEWMGPQLKDDHFETLINLLLKK